MNNKRGKGISNPCLQLFNHRAVFIYGNAYYAKYHYRLKPHFKRIHISDYRKTGGYLKGRSFLMGPLMRKYAPYSDDWTMAEMRMQVGVACNTGFLQNHLVFHFQGFWDEQSWRKQHLRREASPARIQPGSVVSDEPPDVGARSDGNVSANGWPGGIKCCFPVRILCLPKKHKENKLNKKINDDLFMSSKCNVSIQDKTAFPLAIT